MRFSVFADFYLTVNEARYMRASARKQGYEEKGIFLDLARNRDYEFGLAKNYPIHVQVRAYEVERSAFEMFALDWSLYATDTQTGGVLGGDGGFGWTPAILFEHDAGDYSSFGSAYVVIWPEPVRPLTRPRDWDKVAKVVIDKYRDGV